MKRVTGIVLASGLMLAACGQTQTAEETASTETAAPAEAGASAASQGFDIETVAVSPHDLGAFPFFNLPEGFEAQRPSTRDFEQKYVFPAGQARLAEGRYYHARVGRAGMQEWNETLFLRSFDEKIRELGGVQVYDGGLPDTVREKLGKGQPRSIEDLYDPSPYSFRQYVIRTPEGPVWVEIGYGYNMPAVDLTILQEAGLKQTITQITADSIDKDLKASGKAVLHILFDTDKAALKAEGQAVVAEIASLLKAQPDLKLSIEGHTDDTGSAERNRSLSQARAESVKAALEQVGIAPGRLKAAGFGAERPLAGNATEADRAKNRRVELVKF